MYATPVSSYILRFAFVLYCVEDSNPYQLSCPSISVDGALASIVECRGFESNLRQVFFFPWRKVAVLGV